MSKLKSTHEGKITLGESELNCAVLSNGTRIITKSAVFRAFGRTKRGRIKGEIRVPNMPAFIDANNLQPFIGEELEGVLKQVDYIDINGNESSGYDANILPLMCKMYLDARDQKVLKKLQLPLARASEILLLGLSKLVRTALDEFFYYYLAHKDEERRTEQERMSKFWTYIQMKNLFEELFSSKENHNFVGQVENILMKGGVHA